MYRNQKTFLKYHSPPPPPCVPAKAFAFISVTIFYTLCGSGLLAHGGGGGGGCSAAPKPKIIKKCLSYGIRN